MATWQEIQQGIFAGESGGDYNALFGYQNRPGGIFSDVKVSEMSIADILDFTNPRGAYGQFVANTRPDPEMGVATPVGAYQVVGTTLRDAVKKLGIDPSQKFDKATQDRIGKYIFETQGAKAFAGYKGPKMDGQQPTAQQMQQMQQQPRGLMGFLRDPRTRQTLASLDRSGMFQGIAEQATRDIVRQEERQTANRTAAWLKTQPGGEPYAQAIESGMDARTVYSQYMQRSKPTKATYGMTPHFIKDADGKVKVVQFSSTGEQKVSDLPEGFKLAKGVEKIDAGTHFELRDAITNELLGTVDKNVGAVEAEKQAGKMSAEAVAELPATLARSNDAVQLIDEIINSGEIPNILGDLQGRVTPRTVGARAVIGQGGIDVLQKISRLQGSVFLEAFQRLKGGGQITEIEGAKAEASMIDLNNRFVSPNAYISELRNLKSVILEGMQRARNKALAANQYTGTFNGSIANTVTSGGSAEVSSDTAQPQQTQQATSNEGGWTVRESGVKIREKKDTGSGSSN
jgi:hypothetical protein